MDEGLLTYDNMGPEASYVDSESYKLCRAIRAPRGRITARGEPQINNIVRCEGSRNSMSGTSVSSKNTSADNSAEVANFIFGAQRGTCLRQDQLHQEGQSQLRYSPRNDEDVGNSTQITDDFNQRIFEHQSTYMDHCGCKGQGCVQGQGQTAIMLNFDSMEQNMERPQRTIIDGTQCGRLGQRHHSVMLNFQELSSDYVQVQKQGQSRTCIQHHPLMMAIYDDFNDVEHDNTWLQQTDIDGRQCKQRRQICDDDDMQDSQQFFSDEDQGSHISQRFMKSTHRSIGRDQSNEADCRLFNSDRRTSMSLVSSLYDSEEDSDQYGEDYDNYSMDVNHSMGNSVNSDATTPSSTDMKEIHGSTKETFIEVTDEMNNDESEVSLSTGTPQTSTVSILNRRQNIQPETVSERDSSHDLQLDNLTITGMSKGQIHRAQRMSTDPNALQSYRNNNNNNKVKSIYSERDDVIASQVKGVYIHRHPRQYDNMGYQSSSSDERGKLEVMSINKYYPLQNKSKDRTWISDESTDWSETSPAKRQRKDNEELN